MSDDITTKTAESCLKIAKGCHDYNGGYHDKRDSEAYHHGIQTVINALESYTRNGFDDFQVKVLHSIGGEA